MAEHRGGSGNFAEDREKASEAGKKGGQNSGGNFANDREKASEAGKKGGQNSHGGGRKSEQKFADADFLTISPGILPGPVITYIKR